MRPIIKKSIYTLITFGCLLTSLKSLQASNATSAEKTHPNGPDCLYDHMKEAKELNFERAGRYAELSNGKSLMVSGLLIGSESLAQMTARIFDQRAHKFRQAGIPVLCEDLMLMKSAPEQQVKKEPSRSTPTKYGSAYIQDISEHLRTTLENDNFSNLEYISDLYVELFMSHKDYYCMTRHLLESIRRSSGLYEKYQQAASEKNISGLNQLMSDYLNAQINLLGFSFRIDQLAYDLSNEGINIVCGDVPHIPRAKYREN